MCSSGQISDLRRIGSPLMNLPRIGLAIPMAAAAALCGCGGSASKSTTPTAASVSGSYVYSITGTDPNDGDYAVVGSFVADGKGGITSAVADYNLGSGIDANVPLTGTYTVSGGVATVNLTDGGAVQDSFTTSLVVSGSSQISSFDGTGSGTLYPQTATGFNPVGAYALTVKGEQQGTVTGSGQVVVGPGDTVTGGTLSYMDGPTLSNYSAVTGFVDPPDSGGRGFASLAGNDLGYYVISPTQVVMIGLDERALLVIPATKQ